MRTIFLFTLVCSIFLIVAFPVTATAPPLSQPPFTIVCTPPPCSVDKYACPGDAGGCPGGCGMICVDENEVVLPVSNYTIYCTPPPCSTDKYACPGDAGGCPGGCGMVCIEGTQLGGSSLLVILGMVLVILVAGRLE